jgi:hypothetical protein
MVIETAHQSFEKLRLRTDCERAGNFYEALGFQRCDGEASCTHTLSLKGRATPPAFPPVELRTRTVARRTGELIRDLESE